MTDLATDQAEPLTLTLTPDEWLTVRSGLCRAVEDLTDDIATLGQRDLPATTAAMIAEWHGDGLAEIERVLDRIDLFLDTTTDD